MKLVFWSPRGGQTGTTSNMLLVASYAAMKDRKEVVMMQAQQNAGELEQAVLAGTEVETIEAGMDSLVRIFKSEPLQSENIEACCIDIYQKCLRVLPATRKKNQEVYEAELAPMVPYFINACSDCFQQVYVDVGSDTSKSTERVFEEADMIVVNLSQSRVLLDEYFMQCHRFSKKVFYIIGQYQRSSKYNINYICNHYRIKKHQIGYICYESGFMDGMSDGEVISYLLRTMESKKQDEAYQLIQDIKKTYESMISYKKERKRYVKRQEGKENSGNIEGDFSLHSSVIGRVEAL